METYRSAVTTTGPRSSSCRAWPWAIPGPASAAPTIRQSVSGIHGVVPLRNQSSPRRTPRIRGRVAYRRVQAMPGRLSRTARRTAPEPLGSVRQGLVADRRNRHGLDEAVRRAGIDDALRRHARGLQPACHLRRSAPQDVALRDREECGRQARERREQRAGERILRVRVGAQVVAPVLAHLLAAEHVFRPAVAPAGFRGAVRDERAVVQEHGAAAAGRTPGRGARGRPRRSGWRRPNRRRSRAGARRCRARGPAPRASPRRRRPARAAPETCARATARSRRR